MAEVKLRDLGFMGRVLDSTSQDFQGSLRRFTVVAERTARYVVLPSSARDVSLAIKFAAESVHVALDIVGASF